MTRFMGTHTGRLDKKGRVSVPALFRTVMADLDVRDIVFRPSHLSPCIEGWPPAEFDALTTGLDTLDIFSQAHTDLATSLFSDACTLRPDGEGRIVLPESLIVHAGLEEAVSFVGVGRIFQVWNPAHAAENKAQAAERARQHGMTVPAIPARRLPGIAP